MNKKLSFGLSLIVLLVAGCTNNNSTPKTSSSEKTPISSSEVSSSKVESTSTTISSSSSSEVIAEYDVTFYVDGKVYHSVKVLEGNKVAKPADPTKDGFNFIRWCSDELLENEFDFNSTINSSLNLYAEFEEKAPETYVITFDANGGVLNGEATQTVIEGMSVVAPSDPTRDGYEFLGWSSVKDSLDFYDFSSVVTSSFTLYASWKEIQVEALFNVTASSEESLGKKADYAVDGNVDTYWKASDTSKQTLTIDLEEVKDVSYVSQEFNDLNTWNFVIEGSIDNEEFAVLYQGDASASGQKYEVNVNGLYRYIRLTVEDSGVVATSREFNVVANEIGKGTNIAYGMKGVADCWAGGCEPERMFDGDEGNYHCSASGLHENHYMGMDANKVFYVTYIEVLFVDAVDHKFNVDAKAPDGSWFNVEGGDYTQNAENIGVLKLDVNAEIMAILLHHNGNSTGNWPAIREFKVFGFESYANQVNHEVVENKEVYDMGSLSYIDRVSFNNKETSNKVIEVSKDNETWETVALENIEGEYALINKEARYVRYSDNSATLGANNIEIFATKYERNLAMLLSPTATTMDNSGYEPLWTTFNTDCVQAAGRFYCAKGANSVEVIDLDLKRPCIVNSISYKWQDNAVDPTYKLKIEVSLDGETYTTLYDSVDYVAGQVFVAETTSETRTVRYVRFTAQSTGWTNCNAIEVLGYGSTR